MRLNRNMMFKDLIHGFEPRAVLPDNVTVHRIAELADALQTAQRRVSRAAIIRQFVNLPCIGIQLDLWTDSNGGIAYAGAHDSWTVETEEGIFVDSSLVDFAVFRRSRGGGRCRFSLRLSCLEKSTPLEFDGNPIRANVANNNI